MNGTEARLMALGELSDRGLGITRPSCKLHAGLYHTALNLYNFLGRTVCLYFQAIHIMVKKGWPQK